MSGFGRTVTVRLKSDDHSDHLFPNYNTHIPDAPLAEDPARFSRFGLSLASIFKTVNLIHGIPPLNQYDAAATDLRDLFTSTPDFTPYNAAPILFAKGASPAWIAASRSIDFSRPDADEVKLRNAIVKSEGLPRPRPAK